MKIVFYNVTTANKIGGIEVYCWEMAKTLGNLGLEVDLVSGEGNFIKYSEVNRKLFPFKPREKFPDFGTRFRKLMERLSFFKNTKSYLKNSCYDVFLLFKPFDFVPAWFVKKWHPEVLTVFISGGEDFWWFDRYFLKSIDLIISVSKENAKIIKQRYKVEPLIIPNGVDVKKFRPLKKEGSVLKKKLGIFDKKVIISVGRIVGWKGYQLVIKALKRLPEEFVYVLIGEGPYLKNLQKLAEELEVKKRVFFLGSKFHDELPKYYSMGDVFVQPSIGHEAFGITVIEAMACGLPVVGSTSGGIKGLIKDDFNGCLFEIGNVSEFVEKIKRAFTQKKRLSKNAREFVKENFSWEKTAHKLIEAIEKNKNIIL